MRAAPWREEERQEQPQPLWTRAYSLTILATLFLFIPYSLYLPVLPLYAVEELHVSAQIGGALNAVFLLASVLFRTQTGRLEMVFGRKRVLLGSCGLFFLTNGLFLLTTDSIALLMIRFVSGAAFAVMNTAIMAFGSQLAPPERRGEGIAYMTTVFTAGSAIGPFCGLWIAAHAGFQWVFLFCGAATLIGGLILQLLPLGNLRRHSASWLLRVRVSDLLEASAMPAATVTLLLSLAYAGVLSFVSLYAKELGLAAVSSLFFVVMAAASVASRMVSGQVFDRWGADVVMAPAMVLQFAGLALLGTADSSFELLLAAVLIGVAYGVAVPSMQALAVSASAPDRISTVTATYFTCLDVGLGAGSYLLGLGVPLLGFGNSYLAATPLILVAALLYIRMRRRAKQYTLQEELQN